MRLKMNDIAEIGLGASAHGRSVVGKGDTYMPFISIKDVRVGYVDFSGVEEIPVDDEEKAARYCVQEDDVVVTLRGSSFRAGLVKNLPENSLINSNLAYIRLKKGGPISPMVLCAWLNSPEGKTEAELLQHGSGILSISISDLKTMPVSVPSQDIQEKLEDLIRSWTIYTQSATEAYAMRERIFEATIARSFKEHDDIKKECA